MVGRQRCRLGEGVIRQREGECLWHAARSDLATPLHAAEVIRDECEGRRGHAVEQGRRAPGVCAEQRASVKSRAVPNTDRAAPPGTERKAVVLLSGGLDSTTVLAIAKAEGVAPYAMSFRYGQRHVVELDSARRVAAQMGVRKHVIVDIDLRQFGGSALTDDIDVPKGRSAGDMSAGIPITYVPARNTIFLSFALGW